MFKTELIIWKIPQGPICADAPQGLLARSRDCNGRLQDSRMDKASQRYQRDLEGEAGLKTGRWIDNLYTK